MTPKIGKKIAKHSFLNLNIPCLIHPRIMFDRSICVECESFGGLLKYDLDRDLPLRLEK